MGEVYAAYDEMLEQLLALKTVAVRDTEAEQLGARMRREVLLARRVSHPHMRAASTTSVCTSPRVAAGRLPS
jgi:serine/threonine protein kinase